MKTLCLPSASRAYLVNRPHSYSKSVAIVIAPIAKPSIGIFRLTDPPGLSIISRCKQGNDFHPHYEVGPLYVDAYAGGDEDEEEGRSSRDGHVVVVRDKVKCRLIDLR